MTNSNNVPVYGIPLKELGIGDSVNIKELTRTFYQHATIVLAKEGVLVPVLFVFTEQICFVFPAEMFMQNNRTKNLLRNFLREIAIEEDVLGIAMVMDSWIRNTPICDHPDRKAAIVVQCEWYNGNQFMITGKYSKQEDKNGIEQLIFEDPLESNHFEGRFSNVFPPTRSTGYLN